MKNTTITNLFKANLENYICIPVKSYGTHHFNKDAAATVNSLKESNEIAFKIKPIGYATNELGVESTFRTLKEAHGIAKPVVIDGTCYLVKEEYFEAFRSSYGSNRNCDRIRCSKSGKVITTVNAIETKLEEVKEDSKKEVETIKSIPTAIIKDEFNRLPNRRLLEKLKDLWDSGVEIENISLKDLTNFYIVAIMSAIRKHCPSKIDRINFADYSACVLSDKYTELNYVISLVSNEK